MLKDDINIIEKPKNELDIIERKEPKKKKKNQTIKKYS